MNTSGLQLSTTTASSASLDRYKLKSDLVILTYMAQQLSHALQQTEVPLSSPTATTPVFPAFQDCRKGTSHRIALYHPHELLLPRRLSFVGFVSGRQQEASSFICHEIERIDALLVAELVQVPGLLSYSSLQMRPGRWYNLVVFQSVETKAHVITSHLHSYAAYQLAPLYYSWIRLHHGIMPAGLAQQDLQVQSTKYYTFQKDQLHPDMYEITYEHQ